MRTYTQYVTEGGFYAAPWQALIMMAFMLDGPQLTAKELTKKIKATPRELHSALYKLREKGWLETAGRAEYLLTRKGRNVWQTIMDREVSRSQFLRVKERAA